MLAAVFGRQVELGDELRPCFGHGVGRIASFGEQANAGRVGLGLELPIVAEQREDRAKLGELLDISGVDSRRAAGHAADQRQRGEDVGFLFLVAELAKLVLAQEVTAFVGDDPGELRLVAHPQEEAGEDHRKPGRKHHRVEFRNARKVNAHVLRGRPPDLADQPLQVARDADVLDEDVRPGDFLLDPLDLLPQAFFVGIDRTIAGADQRLHVAREDAGGGDPGAEARGECPGAAQHCPPAEPAHCRAPVVRAASRPGFIRPSNRSTIWSAPACVRMSPKPIPGIWLPVWRTLNHTTSPERRLTRLA